jgi:hypothetical protein
LYPKKPWTKRLSSPIVHLRSYLATIRIPDKWKAQNRSEPVWSRLEKLVLWLFSEKYWSREISMYT